MAIPDDVMHPWEAALIVSRVLRPQAAAAAQPTRVSKQQRWKKLDELLSRASLYSDFLTEQLVESQQRGGGAQTVPEA
jgi:hypothetical protein